LADRFNGKEITGEHLVLVMCHQMNAIQSNHCEPALAGYHAGRELIWDLDDSSHSFRFLIHDHDTKFSSLFDHVFISKSINVIHTPFQAPKANSFAERWVRSMREECLDHILIINQNHLHRVLKEYVNYYNHHRPHQGIQQQFPILGPRHNRYGPVRKHNILGGIIHDYYRQPSSST